MVENKAQARALKDTNYKVKLLLGSDPEHGSKMIDITEPVKEALSYDDVFPYDIFDYGIANKIIGILEVSGDNNTPNYTASPSLRTHRSDVFIIQDIDRIIDAAIVNAKQADSIKMLIADAFQKREDERMRGVDFVLQEHLDER